MKIYWKSGDAAALAAGLASSSCDGQVEVEIKPDYPATPAYWQCRCREENIHPAFIDYCGGCGDCRLEEPDARLAEVMLSVKRPECISCMDAMPAERVA